jgi:hypothetical protein
MQIAEIYVPNDISSYRDGKISSVQIKLEIKVVVLVDLLNVITLGQRKTDNIKLNNNNNW